MHDQMKLTFPPPSDSLRVQFPVHSNSRVSPGCSNEQKCPDHTSRRLTSPDSGRISPSYPNAFLFISSSLATSASRSLYPFCRLVSSLVAPGGEKRMPNFRISSENTGCRACEKRISLQGDSSVPHENDALEPRNNSEKERVWARDETRRPRGSETDCATEWGITGFVG